MAKQEKDGRKTSEPTPVVRLAIPNKGRIAAPVMDLVEKSGLHLPEIGERRLITKTLDPHVEILFARPVDIPEYVAQKYTATKEMRTVKFTMFDRLILTQIELNPAFKAFLKYAILALIIFGLQPSGIIFKDALQYGLPILLLIIIAIIRRTSTSLSWTTRAGIL